MRLLFLSLVIVGMISGLTYVSSDRDTWVTTTFFAFAGGWPIIVMILIVIRDWNNLPPVDNIKMQNYYNLDAMRRNSDQAARDSWRNKK